MADQTQGSIVIEADPAVIMAEIADYDSYPEWSGEIKKVEIRETDDQGRGKRVSFEVASGPLKADYVLDYRYKPGDAGVSWTFVEGTNLRNMEGEYTLAAQAPGKTNVTYTLKVDTPIPMLGFMKRQVEKKIIDVALKGLKKRVESRS
ncbi:MAG TPA: SRPBCC family protein [Actinomycetota bacterium]|nr:SRPBCC family protein [Actinomycetota bacterium]